MVTNCDDEIDLLLLKNGCRIGVECKRADAPAMTPSMRIALSDLKLSVLFVVYPGEKRYALADKVMVMPLAEFINARWKSAGRLRQGPCISRKKELAVATKMRITG